MNAAQIAGLIAGLFAQPIQALALLVALAFQRSAALLGRRQPCLGLVQGGFERVAVVEQGRQTLPVAAGGRLTVGAKILEHLR